MVSQTRLLALALMSTLMLLVVDARYLPTRSDDLQKDHIRDILRGVKDKDVGLFVDVEGSVEANDILNLTVNPLVGEGILQEEPNNAEDNYPERLVPVPTQSLLPQPARVDPGGFELPEFPVHLRNKMVSIQKGQVSDDLRKKIIDTLFCALCTRTLYPHQLYEEAAKALVKRYPRLADASALGYKTWQASLRYKGKNVRRRLPAGDVEVDKAREEARIQKERRSLEAAAGRDERTDEMTGAAIAKRRVCKPYFGVGEDEYSINGHIAYMVVETRKALWDREKVKDAMDRSFEERQQWMVGGRVVSDIVERFPALKKSEEILNEFERRTDKSADEGLRSFLNEKIKRIFAILTEKFCTRKDASRVLELCKEASGEEKDRILTCAALDLLPRLVKEKSSSFIKKLVPGERHIHPTVLFSGEDAVSSASMQVAVEGLTVDVADVVEGVSLMMAMYWAFDIEYRPSVKNTLVILERAMGVKETTITMTALKVIGNL